MSSWAIPQAVLSLGKRRHETVQGATKHRENRGRLSCCQLSCLPLSGQKGMDSGILDMGLPKPCAIPSKLDMMRSLLCGSSFGVRRGSRVKAVCMHVLENLK